MTTISVDVTRLHQALWNSLLFTTKTAITAGKILFKVQVTTGAITLFACDDFIAVQDSVEFSVTEQAAQDVSFTLPLATVKALETATRTLSGQIEISITEGKFLCLDSDEHFGEVDEAWNEIVDLATTPWNPTEFALDFYLNPDRLKQIPRMKIPGDHPVGFRYAMVGEQTVVPFIYGSTVAGVIISMDEATLAERSVYLWPNNTPKASAVDKLAHVNKDQMEEFGY